MTAASLTSAVRAPRRRSRRRGPTLASSPEATTTRYDRLPRLTSTIIWFFRRFAPPGERIAAQSGYQVFRIWRDSCAAAPRDLLPRGWRHRLRGLDLQDGGRDEHDQLAARGLRRGLLEQPAD